MEVCVDEAGHKEAPVDVNMSGRASVNGILRYGRNAAVFDQNVDALTDDRRHPVEQRRVMKYRGIVGGGRGWSHVLNREAQGLCMQLTRLSQILHDGYQIGDTLRSQ